MDRNDSTYTMEEHKININARGSIGSKEEHSRNRDAYDSTYGMEGPYGHVDEYDSTYSMEDPNGNMDGYDSAYGMEEPYGNMDEYDNTYGMEEPSRNMDGYDNTYGVDKYDSAYGAEDHYRDAYDSAYGMDDPHKDAYDSNYGIDAYNSTYGMEGPNEDTYDSTYGFQEPNMDEDASAYNTEEPKMNMDGVASSMAASKKGRCLLCSMCCHLAPSRGLLNQHYKSPLHKYMHAIDRKRRNLVKNLKSLEEAIGACGQSEPLIGLECIYQYAPSKKGAVLYGCKICEGLYQYDMAFLHIVNPKHRIAYLSKYHPEMGIDMGFTLNSPADCEQLHNRCYIVEKTYGRKRVQILNTFYTQKKSAGMVDDQSGSNDPSQRDNVQNYTQSAPGGSMYGGEEWSPSGNDSDYGNNGSMNQGGPWSSSGSYGGFPNSDGGASFQDGDQETYGSSASIKKQSRRSRFSYSPNEGQQPQGRDNNCHLHSDPPTDGPQFHYDGRQDSGVQSDQSNAEMWKPNYANRVVVNNKPNQSDNVPAGRKRASRFDCKQGPERRDRDQKPCDEQRDRNASRERRFQQGDRDNSKYDRRTTTHNDYRRGSETQDGYGRNHDRLPHNDACSDHSGDDRRAASRDYRRGSEKDGYGNANDRRRNDDRFSRNERQESPDGGVHPNGTWSTSDIQRRRDECRFYARGKGPTFLELKEAHEAGILGKGNSTGELGLDDVSDMDACSMDLSDEEEDGSFKFSQEVYDFLKNYHIQNERDEMFVKRAKELIVAGLTRFGKRMEESLKKSIAEKVQKMREEKKGARFLP